MGGRSNTVYRWYVQPRARSTYLVVRDAADGSGLSATPQLPREGQQPITRVTLSFQHTTTSQSINCVRCSTWLQCRPPKITLDLAIQFTQMFHRVFYSIEAVLLLQLSASALPVGRRQASPDSTPDQGAVVALNLNRYQIALSPVLHCLFTSFRGELSCTYRRQVTRSASMEAAMDC